MTSIVAVVGPTAAGKSAVGLELAQELGGEVVNADAMQLYAGMDIGTAKVSTVERGLVPHHLLDVWPVTFRASVADYQRRAVAAVADISGRGRVAVVVGGSGLYLRALLDDLRIPPTDPDVRSRLEQELAQVGPAVLHERLKASDPAAGAAILASNGRRIVRALEVVELTGSFSATLPDGRYRRPDTLQLGLDAADLDERIAARVERMFADGFVEEVEALLDVGLGGSPTASKALGYAQILAMREATAQARPRLDLAAAQEATVLATRRFARRQRSWFRRDPRIDWHTSPEQVVRAAVHALRAVEEPGGSGRLR